MNVQKAPSVLLREMTLQEFQAFSEYSAADYARDLIQSRGLSPEDAHRQARLEFAALLPDELSTRGSVLRVIMTAQDKRPVGMIWFLFEETDGVKHAFVNDFAISAQERRKGYASAALAQMERLALAYGCEECRLFVWNGNPAGKALYDKCGYTAFRQESDGIYMTKKIEPGGFSMKKLTFGTPEALVPSIFCKNFSYKETEINYPVDAIQFRTSPRGCILSLPLGPEEQIYGLGLQLKAFNLRGRKMTVRPNADPVAATGDSHAPAPFFVSTAGYGVYVDTARYAEFHFGSSDFLRAGHSEEAHEIAVTTEALYARRTDGISNISIQIPVAQGVDIYIIEGDTITDVVAQYNRLSGGGCSAPDWALSAIYRCFGRYSQQQVLQTAQKLRRDGFAIGTIGLEPGWQTQTYSCSYLWSPERFPDPQALVDSLRKMDYHVNLWEHAFVHPTSPVYDALTPYSGDYEVWHGCVPDLSLEPARTLFAGQQQKLVDMGIDGFKLDECDGSDYTGGWSFPNLSSFPSGLDGEQYHSLFGVLYMQTMLKALGSHKTLSEVRNAGALSASYPFVLYSDLYDHADFIRGCATAGFSGLLWTPEVRDAQTAEEFIRRLQSNVFSVQCLINAWYCENLPWEEHGCAEKVRELLDLRETLKPMLHKAFERYHDTGIPPVRALVSDYTQDPQTYNIDDQYIFCDRLIVAPILAGQTSRTVYLPEGNWRDFFTKESVASGTFTVETDSIPVYEKVPED